MLISKSVCEDVSRYEMLADRWRRGVNTLAEIVTPPFEHTLEDGVVTIPGRFEFEDRDMREDEVTCFTGGIYGLSPILEHTIRYENKPLIDELRELGSYDLVMTPVLDEIKQKEAGKSTIFEPWDWGQITTYEPEEENYPTWLNDEERALLDQHIADIRAYIKYKGAVKFRELIQNPNGSAIPTLLLAHPSFTLAIVTSEGLGIKGEDPEQRLGTLNLIVVILEKTFRSLELQNKVTPRFKRDIDTLNKVIEILESMGEDPSPRVISRVSILDSVTKRLSKKAIDKYHRLVA